MTRTVLLTCCFQILSTLAAVAADISFERDVAPILAARCLECHNGAEKKGNLDLTSLATALAGGEGGPALVAGDADASYLWQRIEAGEMPPKKHLTDAEKQTLRQWLTEGAKWERPIDRFKFTSDVRAGYDWWSLQKLGTASGAAVPSGNAIDAFVVEKLKSKGLSLSPPADRRTLIRRLSFDLLGLPPTAEEVAGFVADDLPDAYEKLVDRLLASPHYGERWARHWLDVARFGESDGFEYDRLRPNAWVYRDWVVNALNADLPYDEFARLQIAGDVLKPDSADAISATGFLVCGAHDSLIPAGDVMRKIMREDEMEDLVGTVAQTYLGLTVNCARCHDHKFDPILQADYYRLASALAGVARGDRALPASSSPDNEAARSALAAAKTALDAIDRPMRETILAERLAGKSPVQLPDAMARWNFAAGLKDEVSGREVSLVGTAKQTPEGLEVDGQKAFAQSAVFEKPLKAKTLEARVRLANLTQRGGAPISVQTPDGGGFDAIVFGEQEPGHWMAGSEGFRRTRSFEGAAETVTPTDEVHVAITYADDGTITLYRNASLYGKAYNGGKLAEYEAGRFQLVFGLRHAPVNASKLFAGTIVSAALYDRVLSAEEISAVAGASNAYIGGRELQARLSAEDRQRRTELTAEIARLEVQLRPREQKAFVVTPRAAPVVHRLDRGNPLTPKEEVVPGGIPSLAGVSADFGLKADAADRDRRQRLAAWITDPGNPLFARVMVNRVWHYHFGVGIVETPNDFGFSGGRPSHPELLDWLAGEFVRSGFRLKQLHRLIVTSDTYRQSSLLNAQAHQLDASNRFLWRYSPRRLEAETVRDAVLAVSGQLNLAIGGPGFRDFDLQDQKNTAVYIPRDAAGPEFQRRSLYRTWARGARHPLLDSFDCPDTSVTSPLRGVTTTPLQALSLLNNSFMLRMSDEFASHLTKVVGSVTTDQTRAAYQQAFGRDPTTAELDRVVPFVDKHGLPALCRALFNSNEFLYVE